MKRMHPATMAIAFLALVSLQQALAAPGFTKLVSAGAGLALKGLVQSADGGYLLLGKTSLADSGHDACVIKLDPSGALVWATAIGSAAEDDPCDMIETPGGQIIGTFSREGGRPTGVAWEDEQGSLSAFCLSPEGRLRWCRTLEKIDVRFARLAAGGDGSVVVLTYNREDCVLLGLDREGFLTSTTVVSPQKDHAIAPNLFAERFKGERVLPTHDGGLLLGGDVDTDLAIGKSHSISLAPALVKLGADRGCQWSFAYRRVLGNLTSLAEEQDGYVASFVSLASPYATTIIKVDETGNLVWSKAYVPVNKNERPSAVREAAVFPDGRMAFVRGNGDTMVTDSAGRIIEQRNVAETLGRYVQFAEGNGPTVIATQDSCLAMAWVSVWWGEANELPLFGKTAPLGLPDPWEPVGQGAAMVEAAPPEIEILALAVEARDAALFNTYGLPYRDGYAKRETDVRASALPAGTNVRFLKRYSVFSGSEVSRELFFSDAVKMEGTAIIALEGQHGANRGICLVKLDGDGNVLGTLFLDMDAGPEGVQLLRTERNTVLLLGESGAGRGQTTWLIEADADLHLLWRTKIGGGVKDTPQKLIPVAGGGYLLLSTTQSYGLAHSAVLLSRLDARGTAQWVRTLGGALDQEAVDVAAAPDGGAYVLANERAGAEASRDILAARLTAAGRFMWQKRLGASLDDEALCALAAPDGKLTVLFRSTSLRKDGGAELGMFALDAQGTLAGQWYFQNSRAASVWQARAADGGFLIAWNTDADGAKRQTDLRWMDGEGGGQWSLTLPDLVDFTLCEAGLRGILASVDYADPAWVNEGAGRFYAPLLISLDEEAVRTRKELGPLARLRMSSLAVSAADLKRVDRPTTGLSARPIDTSSSTDYRKLRVTAMAQSALHTLLVTSDGTLWSLGLNDHGQLGDGTTTNSNHPVKVMAGVTAVAAGSFYSLALKTDGTLWAFGENAFGKLGDGTTQERHSPVPVMQDVAAISAGGHSLAVKTDGSLWAFGLNHAGQLGDGTKENHATPVKVMDGVKAATAGLHHSLALKTDGTLWTFGRNDFGQLGVYERPDRPVPAQVLTDVTAIATGGNDSWAIRADGSLWGFGGGVGPTPRRFAEGVIAVASAAGHTLVVKADRSVWGFGENGAGELGKTTRSNYSRELIRVMDNGELVAAGNGSSLVLKTDGTLWGFGANNWGQLGKGDTRKGPVEIMVSAGPAATLVTFGVCIDSRVRVRSEAGLWAATLGYLENGDPVEILEKSPMKMWVESVEDYWYRIRRLTDGLTGWSFGKYLKMKTEEWRAPEPP